MALATRLFSLVSTRSSRVPSILSPTYKLSQVTLNSRWKQCACFSSEKRGKKQLDSEELSGDSTEHTLDQETAASITPAQKRGKTKTKFRSKLKLEAQKEANIELEQLQISQEPKDTLFNFGKLLRSLESMKETLAKKNLLPSEFTVSATQEEETCYEGSSTSREKNLFYLPSPKRKLAHQQDHPETEELVKHIFSEYKLLKLDQDRFANAVPSVVGSSVNDVKAVISDLQKAGLDTSEIRLILPCFPLSLLDIDFQNVGEVYLLMKEEYDFPNRALRELLRQHPHIFTIDKDEIKLRLELFSELGLSGPEVGALVSHFPILLSTPLTESSMEALRQAVSHGLDGRWLTKTISYNLHMRPAKLALSCETTKIVSLLNKYGIDVAQCVTKYPEVLQLQVSDIQPVLRALSGKPLYLNTTDIHALLQHNPHLLLGIKQMDALRAHLTDLCHLFGGADNVRWEIRSVKGLLDPQCDVNGKLDLLASSSFTEEEAITLVCKSPSILLQSTVEELAPKLELFLSLNGVTPSFLADTPARKTYLHLSCDLIQARCSFARKHNESLLDASNLEDLFGTTDEEFASLCDQDHDTYIEETAELDSESSLCSLQPTSSDSQSSVSNEDKADFNLIGAKTIHSNALIDAKTNAPIEGNVSTDSNELWECHSEVDTAPNAQASKYQSSELTNSTTSGESEVEEVSDPPVEVIASLEQTVLQESCIDDDDNDGSEDGGDVEPTDVNSGGVWLNDSLSKELTDMLLELRRAAQLEIERDAVIFGGVNTQEDVVDYLWDEFDDHSDLERNSVR